MAKKSSKKRAGARRQSRYTCDICGLVVTSNNSCGCVEACDIICCGEQMKKK